jgi:hypothetical protein
MSVGDWIGALIGFALTLMVFSYLFQDNHAHFHRCISRIRSRDSD